MRDYSNGGFFFIDAALIQAAGKSGLEIDGIFEDAKRAIEGGKVFVMTGLTMGGASVSGIILPAILGDETIEGGNSELTITYQITNENVVTINIGG